MQRSLRAITMIAGFAGLGLAGGMTTAVAQTDEFYKGKTVSLYVGSSAGGTNDLVSRLVAAHIPRHLPGEPAVVVKNMPGAGSRKLAAHIYSKAARDGTEFANVERPIATEALLDPRIQNPFDILKFTWLGSPMQETLVCVVWHTAKVQSVDDLLNKEFVVATPSSSGGEAMIAGVLNSLVGAKLRGISGYPGGAEMNLAMQRGEVDGRCGLGWGAIQANYAQWLTDKQMKVLVKFTTDPIAGLESVPSVFDMLKSESDRKTLGLILAAQKLGRPFVAPPELPPERKATLRAAFDATLRDPGFITAAQRQKVDLQPLSGAEIDAVLQAAYATPPDIVARAIKLGEPAR